MRIFGIHGYFEKYGGKRCLLNKKIFMSSKLWQHPYVNVLKHFGIGEWKKCTKEGDVSPLMDKQMRGTIYRISGSIPAGNYVQFPRTTTQTLGLTGQYLYIMFKPIPTKYFVVHIDVAANDGSAIRISFSNLFKEFKSTSTWLQFPFVSNPSPTSVESKTSSDILISNLVGTAPQSSRWSLLVLDLHYILSAYLNLSYAYLKNIRLCANMFLKGVFTSDVDYQPGLTSSEARKLGLIAEGIVPLPKEMAFPLPKGSEWQTLYDYVRFPPDKTCTRLGIITSLKEKKIDVLSKRKPVVKSEKRTKDVEVKSKDSYQVKQSEEAEKSFEPTTDRHVYATLKRPSVRKKVPSKLESFTYHPSTLPQKPAKINSQSLKPDPILLLKKIVGFGGGTYKDGLWNINGTTVVYPCYAIIVSMDISTGEQAFLMGHTDKISALAFDGGCNLLASAQAGTPSLIRIWKYHNRKCAALFRTQVFDIHCLSLSNNGNILCAVGRDSHGKQLVAVWDTSQAVRGGQVSLLAKAHTDVHINRMRIADFDDSRMLSCGKENIRFWRLRNGSLRSCPVELRQHSMTEFTDIVYGVRERSSPTPDKIYCSTTSGAIYQLDYHKIVLDRVIKLLPSGGHHSNTQVSINVLVVNELFCATGSDDGYLRLWTTEFSKVLLEAEHEGSVTVLSTSRDGSNVLAGTSMGNLGILNTSSRSYKTIMRSHTDTIHAMNIDHTRRRIGTVSADYTIRIWDMDTLTQLYDFQAPEEEPCAIVFHPFNTCFACGFIDGTVRVFDIQSTNLVAEHKQHRGRVTGLVFAPNGGFLFSSGSLGVLAMYSAGKDDYDLVRMLLDMTPRNENLGPNALSVSQDSKRLAFIGPSEYTVCVVDARSLDEVLRVDITTVASPGRTHIDTARLVCFSAPELNQLLVVTSSNRLLKLNASNGLLLSEVSNVHRHSCTCLDTTSDGRYLATAGDNLIKIWDYHMRLDINFQVFIGHCDSIRQLSFTPGNQELISAGEAILMWDFHGRKAKLPKKRSFGFQENSISHQQDIKTPQRTYPTTDLSNTSKPRGKPPEPTRYEPLELDMSPVRDLSKDLGHVAESPEIICIRSQDTTTNDQRVQQNKTPLMERSYEQLKVQDKVSFKESPTKPQPVIKTESVAPHKPPSVTRHFKRRFGEVSVLAKCRYTAPRDQAGLRLKSVLGYNGRGRHNMIWKYDTGLFAYSSGSIVVIEDLHTGLQRHLIGHLEEISTLTAQNDGLVVASASGSSVNTSSQICIWNVKEGSCEKVFSYHPHEVVCLSYSRDDRYLISIGDYRECSIIVWSTKSYDLMTSSYTRQPIHDLRWDPFRVNEFVSVGHNGSVVFWMLDETALSVNLNMHEPDVPCEVFDSKSADEPGHFTAVCYAENNVLYTGTNEGVLLAWDTQQNKCFIHWKADSAEIDVIVCSQDRLVTGGCSGNIKLWSVAGIADIKKQDDNYRVSSDSLIMEDEMTVDGAVVSASFDDVLQTGIVGTVMGTLWYVNWNERTSIRLVSGHTQEVKSVVFSATDDKYFATCGSDGVLHLWTTDNLEHLQFQVIGQSCNCVAFCPVPELTATTSIINQGQTIATLHPQTTPEKRDSINQSHCVAGYSDGTVRMFDLGRVEMIMKMQPHAASVAHIAFSPDGRVIISGASDGIIAISNPSTGLTVRLLNDHKGAPITDLHSTLRDQHYSISGPMLWMAASKDSRVSIWSAKWSQDFCELVDWLSFPTPSIAPDGKALRRGDHSQYDRLPSSLVRFSPSDPDIIIFTGYAMQRAVQFYSLSQRKVVRTASLTHWATSMDISPNGNLIALGTQERLVQLMDYDEGRFQDFVGHCDSVSKVCFSPSGKLLYTASYSTVLAWNVVV